MVLAYLGDWHSSRSVRMIVATKTIAFAFLMGAWLDGEAAWSVPFSGLADGAMGLVAALVHRAAGRSRRSESAPGASDLLVGILDAVEAELDRAGDRLERQSRIAGEGSASTIVRKQERASSCTATCSSPSGIARRARRWPTSKQSRRKASRSRVCNDSPRPRRSVTATSWGKRTRSASSAAVSAE